MENKIMQTVGERIKKLRAQRSLEQKELAELSGVPLQTIKDIERGKTVTPRQKTLRPLAEALKSDPAYLLLGPEATSP